MPIIIIALISAGIAYWLANTSPLIVFVAGLVSGMLFLLVIIRRLIKWSRKSPIARELFLFVSSYRIDFPTPKTNVVVDQDYQDIVSVLKKQMQFPPAKAREAATYAISRMPNESLEEKIREALIYLGNGHKEIVGSESK